MRKHVTSEEFAIAYKNKDNKRIMRSITNRYSTILGEEELRECALQALWRSLSYHDDTKGQKFTTSLWRFTDWECKRQLRKKNKSRKHNLVSIDNYEIMEKEKIESASHVRECMELLKSEYRDILFQYYFENRTMEEIGQLNNYSKEAARQKIKKARSKLLEIMQSGVSS